MRISVPFLLKLAFSLALLGAVFARVDVAKISAYVSISTPWPLALALALAIAQVPLTSIRWHLLLLSIGVRLPVRITMEVNILSIFANTVLINIIGGMATRVGFLASYGVPAHAALSTSIIERIIIMVVLGAMSVAGIMLAKVPLVVNSSALLWGGAATMVAGLVTLLIGMKLSTQFRNRVCRVFDLFKQIVIDLGSMTFNIRQLTIATLLTIISQCLLVGTGVAIGLLMGVKVPLWEMALILPGITLISSLPIGIGGIGLREVSMVSLLGLLGVEAEQALVTSMIIGMVTLSGSAIAYVATLAVRWHEITR